MNYMVRQEDAYFPPVMFYAEFLASVYNFPLVLDAYETVRENIGVIKTERIYLH